MFFSLENLGETVLKCLYKSYITTSTTTANTTTTTTATTTTTSPPHCLTAYYYSLLLSSPVLQPKLDTPTFHLFSFIHHTVFCQICPFVNIIILVSLCSNSLILPSSIKSHSCC